MDTPLETERTLLRPFTINDAQAVFDFGSNKQVQEFTGDNILSSLDDAEHIIENIFHSDYKKYGYGRLAVVYKAEQKVIGFCGLKYLPEINQTDIGFRFLPDYWGKGIATETATKIIDYGFDILHLKEIIGIADPKNIGSCKVLEKLGLVFYKSDFYPNETDKTYNWYKIVK